MIRVQKHQRGLVFTDGSYVRCLGPGSHFADWVPRTEVLLVDTYELLKVTRGKSDYEADASLMAEMKILDVPDDSIAIHYVDGHLKDIFAPGTYAYWNTSAVHTFKIPSLSSPRIAIDLDSSALNNAGLRAYVHRVQIEAYQKGLLFFDGVYQQTLEPGAHYFWKGPVQVNVTAVDMRQLQLDMTGQEILTLDRVSVRINFAGQYRIVDPVRAFVQIKSYEEQLYIALQLVLREYVGTMTLDDLLQKKEEINQFVLGRLKEKAAALGIEFLQAGVKDIVLPGDFKEIMNLVLVAERKAQANLITRREEIASTRSLLNTARLMDENPTLYRLKELEFVERMAEKVGSISLSPGAGILEQLAGMIASRKDQKPA